MALALMLQPFYMIATEQAASAVASYSATTGFTAAELANWSVDRQTPSGGHSSLASFAGESNVLEMRLNKDGANGAGFYSTEGLKRQTGTSTALKAQLYVDGDWTTNSKTVRAGLWGTGKNDASSSATAYPIVEFTTDGHTGWRVYNTVTGTWINSAASYNLDAWNTLEIELDTTADKFNYLVNGLVVGTAEAGGSTKIAEAILNSKNYGSAAHSYDVHWANFSMGAFVPTPEVTHVDAYFLKNPTYTAIGVDFKTMNVTDAEGIELRVNREGGGEYSIFAKPSLVAAINAQSSPTSTSGPIVIAGSRTSGSWTNQTGSWTGSALPVSVDVIITFDGKDPVSLRDDTISTGKATWDQVKPNQAPAITIATPASNKTVGTKANSNKLKITGTFTDDERANYMNAFLIKDGVLRAQGIVYGYGTPGFAPNYADVNGNFTLNMDVPANLESGSYMLKFVGTDHNAFSPHTTVERNFTIDNTNPETTLVVPTGLAGNVFTVKGVAKDNMALSRVYVQLKHLESNTRYGGTTIHLSGTEKDWSREFDATSLNLPEGTYIAHVQATDKVGNRFDEGWSAEFTLDKTAPTASLVSSHPNPLTTDTVTITGSVSDDDIKSHWFEVTTPTGVYHEYNMNTTDKEFAFVLDTSAGVGEYRVRYVAADRAGNRNDSVTPAILVLNVAEPAPATPAAPIIPARPQGPQGNPDESVVIEEDDGESAPVFTAPIFGFAFQPLPGDDAAQNDNDEENTNETDDSGDVAGVQDQAGTPLEDTGEVLGLMDHKWFGIAWYWFLVILGGLIGAWLMLASAIRRRRGEEA